MLDLELQNFKKKDKKIPIQQISTFTLSTLTVWLARHKETLERAT
jgi:hypothetical protein